jgi:hypothetical protein
MGNDYFPLHRLFNIDLDNPILQVFLAVILPGCQLLSSRDTDFILSNPFRARPAT